MSSAVCFLFHFVFYFSFIFIILSLILIDLFHLKFLNSLFIFIPLQSIPVHKIPSSGEPLTLSLSHVPKLLGCVTGEWSPHAFVVSFKVGLLLLLFFE